MLIWLAASATRAPRAAKRSRFGFSPTIAKDRSVDTTPSVCIVCATPEARLLKAVRNEERPSPGDGTCSEGQAALSNSNRASVDKLGVVVPLLRQLLPHERIRPITNQRR